MPERMPAPTDFSSTLQLQIQPAPSTSPRPTNVLILLHGLGDDLTSFSQLGKKMSLPETVCIALQAPHPMPFGMGGFHWGDELQFDEATGTIQPDTGFSKSQKLIVNEIIEQALLEKCKYSPQEILILGLGQGGTTALAAAAAGPHELGGIVSLGGPSPKGITSGFHSTPTLVCGGIRDSAITPSSLKRQRSVFQNTEEQRWQRAGDGMPRSREEMLPIMQFLARRLRSRHGVPEGSVEVK